MFSPKKDMRDLILEVLRKDSASISGVSRELESRGVKLHRLELTGYLKALADLGVLREKDIKPAKVFSVSSLRERSFHDLLGEACSAVADHPEEQDGQGGMVDVPEVQPVAAGDVVELVPEEAVPGKGQQVEEQLGGRQSQQRPRGRKSEPGVCVHSAIPD